VKFGQLLRKILRGLRIRQEDFDLLLVRHDLSWLVLDAPVLVSYFAMTERL
jgi:hypothetical protein